MHKNRLVEAYIQSHDLQLWFGPVQRAKAINISLTFQGKVLVLVPLIQVVCVMYTS